MSIRDTLFGDRPLDIWGTKETDGAPWLWFAEARAHLAAGQPDLAIQAFYRVVNTPNLESRHYLQAWYFLRDLGVMPPPDLAKQVLGVVVEVDLGDGLDLLAAYADKSARYYNYAGGGVIWDAGNGSTNPAIPEDIQRLLDIAGVVINYIGPWEGDRPGVPPRHYARINLLTPSGLHFGEGPFDVLSADELGGPMLSSATQLMLDLINTTK
ncbi:hypothetical protein H6G89_24710 [Oscillatoria sp. FACHB-1407]|uniref:hypothetical protein n=1 Tax=Oscillatoria sp. FACHB-1407 TaxID=2692847 RepID=UPI0016831675|nr:hypothetical protein [Oscillatoria sp. FACHB-1407]MBD2464209.1 hypothetical protein [Oscillatoria sp. FACHB-1407]